MPYTIEAPLYRRGQETVALAAQAGEEGVYVDTYFTVRQTCEAIEDGLIRIRRVWTNRTGDPVQFQPVLEVRAGFRAEHTVTPSVSYDGNRWGEGEEPKGYLRDGKSWVFSYERTSIPACTLSENAQTALALFASDEDAASLRCSCSLVPCDDGSFLHRILYPVIESPVTYTGRDAYGEATEGWIALDGGESFAATAFLWHGTPYWPNFGIANVEDIAMRCLRGGAVDGAAGIPPEHAWELGIAYAKRLLLPHEDKQLFCIGLAPEGDDMFAPRAHFEIGWCGQNALFARMLMREYLRTGDHGSLNTAFAVLDAWAEHAVQVSGLTAVHYEKINLVNPPPVDTCNLGWAALEFTASYEEALALGIEKPAYLRLARGICDFFVEHFDIEHGFGKSWNAQTGEAVAWGGTIGGFLIPALVAVARVTGEKAYREIAQTSLFFYHERDLSRFACTAGALDTTCIDKETSGPLLAGALMLYEDALAAGEACAATLDALLTIAKQAAYYFSSWAYHYDVLYDADSDFAVYGFHTAGGTSVSAQHHHIDPWGALVVPWYLKLAEYTRDTRWKARGLSMWRSALLCVTQRDGDIVRGRARPLGSQSEGFLHCNWGLRPGDKTGVTNDWLVAWPSAFRLYTLASVLDWRTLAVGHEGR